MQKIPYHPAALTISLLILAESQHKRGDDPEVAVHTVLSRAVDLAGWSEDKRSDLYAQICEKYTPDMRFADLQALVTTSIKSTESRHG